MISQNEIIIAGALTKTLEGLDRIGSSLESPNAESHRLQRNLDIYRDGEIAKWVEMLRVFCIDAVGYGLYLFITVLPSKPEDVARSRNST